MSLADVCASIKGSVNLDGGDSIECAACGRSSDDTSVELLIEHTMFEHSLREDIIIVRRGVLLTGNETAKALDLPVLTAAEERWREDHE